MAGGLHVQLDHLKEFSTVPNRIMDMDTIFRIDQLC